jgi:hypothetical protein
VTLANSRDNKLLVARTTSSNSILRNSKYLFVFYITSVLNSAKMRQAIKKSFNLMIHKCVLLPGTLSSPTRSKASQQRDNRFARQIWKRARTGNLSSSNSLHCTSQNNLFLFFSRVNLGGAHHPRRQEGQGGSRRRKRRSSGVKRREEGGEGGGDQHVPHGQAEAVPAGG